MTYEKIINILKVKWWVIILCGLICAGLMVYEKKNSDYVLQTGDMWVVDAVKLYGFSDKEKFAEDFKLEKFITSYVFLSVFSTINSCGLNINMITQNMLLIGISLVS